MVSSNNKTGGLCKLIHEVALRFQSGVWIRMEQLRSDLRERSTGVYWV